MVSRQLHNERSGIAREHLCLFKHNARNDYCSHTYEVSRGCNKCRAAEDSARYHCNKRNLSAAGYKCSCHNGHTAVALIFNGTRSHNSGDSAACAYKHRYERFTRKTELAEDTVKHECNTGHITARLKECKE